MQKFAKIINKTTGAVEVGIGDPEAVYQIRTVVVEEPTEENPDGKTELWVMYVRDFYKSVGMELMDVEQAHDGAWYLAGKAPVKVTTPKELIEFVAVEADKIAYGGITIIANEQKYLFKTTTDNITRCNAVLARFEVLPEDTIVPWEVWQGDVPAMLPVNKEQFKQCFAFGCKMTIDVEIVKGELNAGIQKLTEEQLADDDYIMAFKENAVIQLSKINTTLTIN